MADSLWIYFCFYFLGFYHFDSIDTNCFDFKIRVRPSSTGAQKCSLNFGFLLHHLFSNFVCKNHFENLLKTQFLRPLLHWFWFSTLGPSICISNQLLGNASTSLKPLFLSWLFAPWGARSVPMHFLGVELPTSHMGRHSNKQASKQKWSAFTVIYMKEPGSWAGCALESILLVCCSPPWTLLKEVSCMG